MSTLIAVAFKDRHKAEEVRLDLLKKQREDLVDLEEAVVLVRDQKNEVHLHHSTHFTVPAAVGAGFLGSLIGLMILNPVIALIGGITGTGVGAAMGALKEIGIEEDFMKDLAGDLKPGSSALFVVARKVSPDTIAEALKDTEGRILQTSLSHEDDKKLKAALNEATGTE
jgi:uncharacterized membrane protein